jgi:hypothetical protein
MIGLTYLSIIGNRNTAERVRYLVWSYRAWIALRKWRTILPGVTAWPKFIATCTRVARKQRGREQNEYKAFHLIQFSSAANITAGLDARQTSKGADSTH